MKFRKHAGGLKESMKTQVEVNSIEEIKTICKESLQFAKDVSIKIKYQCFDERINQESYLVVAYEGEDKELIGVLGMSDNDKFI